MEEQIEIPKPSEQEVLGVGNIIIVVCGLLLIGCLGAAAFLMFGMWAAVVTASVLFLIIGLTLLYLNIDIIWPDDSNDAYSAIGEEESVDDKKPTNEELLAKKMEEDPNFAQKVNQVFSTTVGTIIEVGKNKKQKEEAATTTTSNTTTDQEEHHNEELKYEKILETINEHTEALKNIVNVRNFPGNTVIPTITLLKENPLERGYEHCVKQTIDSINKSQNLEFIEKREEIGNQLNEHFAKLKAALIKQHKSPIFRNEEKALEESKCKVTRREEQYKEKLNEEGLNVFAEKFNKYF